MFKIILLLSFIFAQASFASEQSFPSDFQWCVATSAHQIEGNNFNSDWWDWEQLSGKIKNGDRSGASTNHRQLFVQDVELLKQLHVKTYRMGLEWARIEPSEGVIDWHEVDLYKQELQLYKANGIKVMATLQHFTLPKWVAAKGGWQWSEMPKRFAQFSALMASQYGSLVDSWITLNEPMVLLLAGYQNGLFPPGLKMNLQDMQAPLVNMLKAHALAYHQIKSIAGVSSKIGVAHHLRIFDAYNRLNPLDQIAAKIASKNFNWAFVNAMETGILQMSIPGQLKIDQEIPGLKSTQDFIGINYYSRDRVQFTPGGPQAFALHTTEGAELSDLGWEIYPKGLYRLLKKISRRFPNKDILITENGIADAKDAKRSQFMLEHLTQVQRAIDKGIRVKGYCHWSLMDNFEWAEGFTPRFGLFEVDYVTFARTPRPSALLFAKIAGSNSLE